MSKKTLDGPTNNGCPNQTLCNVQILRIKGMQIGVGFPLFEKQLHFAGAPCTLNTPYEGIALRIEVRDQVLELLLFWIPGNDHSKDERLSMDNPSHLEFDPLFLWKIALDFHLFHHTHG
jgi:hypothetical protein